MIQTKAVLQTFLRRLFRTATDLQDLFRPSQYSEDTLQNCRGYRPRQTAALGAQQVRREHTARLSAMPVPCATRTRSKFAWDFNASAADNLAAVGAALSPLKKVSEQVATNTRLLSRQMSHQMFMPFHNSGSDSEGEHEDEHGHAPHVDDAAAIRKDVAELTQRNHMSRALSAEIETLVERAKALGSPAGHGHHDEGPMPWMSMPTVINRHGEPQPELHIGWADIYLDLILVGVAFNGGLLLKHAFYLCEPHDPFDGWTLDDGSPEGRQLNGHGPLKPCVGLGVGVLHALAFATPLLSAWTKETIYDAQFDAGSLSSRGLEVLCYLLMVLGASCSEDVDVLERGSPPLALPLALPLPLPLTRSFSTPGSR